MSIVYDYLKQIKESKEPPKEPAAGAVQAASASGSRLGIPTWIKYALVFFLCLGIGLAVYFLAPRAVKPIVELYRSPGTDSPKVPMMRSADPSFVLEGIIYNPSQPFAIINGRMLETEGKIGDFEVAEITPDSVTLRNPQDNTARTLRL